MAYKDKQKETQRERQRRYRAERGFKAYPKGVTNSGRDKEGVTEGSIPIETLAEMDSGCGDKLLHGLKPERTAQGNIRVSKPGDDDYVPMCETTKAFIEGRDKRPEVGKRGKDIKHFGDLPMDVQLSIDLMDIGPQEKANRTAIAVNYQHQFSDRFHSTGVA